MQITKNQLALMPFLFGAVLMLGGVLVFFSPWATFLELWLLYQMSLTMFCSGVICFAIGCLAKLVISKSQN